MQQFIDNWSATLLAPATAADVSISVEPGRAALLTGLGGGNFYHLTLVERNAEGIEIDWDVVKVTARASGVLTVIRTATARDWAAGTVIEARLTAEAMEALRDSAGGTTVGSATPQSLGAAAPGTSGQASRQDHVHQAPTPGDIGAATAAQGAKADSAVQPAALTAALSDKVDKVAGKGLSTNDFTTAEKNKLAGLEGSHFKGLHSSLAALQAAHPAGAAGDYADVDAGTGLDVVRYLWDVSDIKWVAQAAAGGSMTPAQVKTAYESNPDTNAFTDAEQSKLAGVAAGATANANTDSLAEGATNKYFTESRVRSAVLTGLSLLTGGAVAAADSVLVAIGKLQKQITDAVTAISSKQDQLVSGTNIKSVNGSSLLGSGDIAISGLDYGAETVVISSGTLNLNATTKEVIVVDLNQNVTSITMPAGVAGQAVNRRIVFTQSGASNFTVAGWTSVTIEGGAAPVAATGVGAVTEYMLSNTNNSGWRMYVDQGITLAQVGQLGGFRNKLINGNFQVNQRVYVSGTATTIANQYTLDRWRVVTSGQNLAFTANGNGNQITAPAGGVEQVIEGINIEGGTYVLNWTGTATATVNGTARAKGETFTLTANTNATVRFIGGTVSQAQLEPGSVATPFEHRPYGVELGLCRRYGRPVCAQMLGNCFGATYAAAYMPLDVPMRTTPTLSSTSGAAVSSAVGAPLSATISIVGMYENNLRIDASVASGLVAGNSTVMIIPATPFLSAEL